MSRWRSAAFGDPYSGPDPASPPGRDALAMRHLAFRATREELGRRGIAVEFQDHEIAHSIYFQDPDGHQIEITHEL